jgi:hypothetical protein
MLRAGANVAKHCIPAVSEDRVSITFRKIGSSIKMKAFGGPHGETGGYNGGGAPPTRGR